MSIVEKDSISPPASPAPVLKSENVDDDLVKRLLKQREKKLTYQKAYDKAYRQRKREELTELKERIKELEDKNIVEGHEIIINKRAGNVVYTLEKETDYTQMLQDLLDTLKNMNVINGYQIEQL